MALTIPVKPGGIEALKDSIDEFVHGETSQAQHDHTVSQGFTHVRMFHQKSPSEALILYVEGPEIHDSLHKSRTHGHEFNKSFAELVQAISGHHVDSWAELPDLLLDWHHQEGHKHKPAKRAK